MNPGAKMSPRASTCKPKEKTEDRREGGIMGDPRKSNENWYDVISQLLLVEEPVDGVDEVARLDEEVICLDLVVPQDAAVGDPGDGHRQNEKEETRESPNRPLFF